MPTGAIAIQILAAPRNEQALHKDGRNFPPGRAFTLTESQFAPRNVTGRHVRTRKPCRTHASEAPRGSSESESEFLPRRDIPLVPPSAGHVTLAVKFTSTAVRVGTDAGGYQNMGPRA
eukprot:3933061-Rhodomonas_salina.1